MQFRRQATNHSTDRYRNNHCQAISRQYKYTLTTLQRQYDTNHRPRLLRSSHANVYVKCIRPVKARYSINDKQYRRLMHSRPRRKYHSRYQAQKRECPTYLQFRYQQYVSKHNGYYRTFQEGRPHGQYVITRRLIQDTNTKYLYRSSVLPRRDFRRGRVAFGCRRRRGSSAFVFSVYDSRIVYAGTH